MKKIISILLCCFLFCSCLVCSVSAADDFNYSSIRGVWQFNDTINVSNDELNSLMNSSPFNYSFKTVRVTEFDNHDGFIEGYNQIIFDLNLKGNISMYYTNSNWAVPDEAYDFGRDTWKGEQYIYFENDYASNENDLFIKFLINNATQLLCDGSTCPTYDSDGDGYCEDCFRSVRSTAGEVVVYPSYLPALPGDVSGGNWAHLIFNRDNTFDGGNSIILYSYVTDDNSYYVWGNSYNDHVQLEATKSSATGNAYELVNGEWKYIGILGGDYYVCDRTDIIWSSVVIYDENGEYFFPLALWAQILKTTQGALMTETPKTVETMTILVVCGVGCLALLIGLPLLLKVFRKFRRV